MDTLVPIVLIVLAASALVTAGSLLAIAFVVLRVRGDLLSYYEKISGTVLAVKELARRAATPHIPGDATPSQSWADLLNGRRGPPTRG